jgi:hypothetical protein
MPTARLRWLRPPPSDPNMVAAAAPTPERSKSSAGSFTASFTQVGSSE